MFPPHTESEKDSKLDLIKKSHTDSCGMDCKGKSAAQGLTGKLFQ